MYHGYTATACQGQNNAAYGIKSSIKMYYEHKENCFDEISMPSRTILDFYGHFLLSFAINKVAAKTRIQCHKRELVIELHITKSFHRCKQLKSVSNESEKQSNVRYCTLRIRHAGAAINIRTFPFFVPIDKIPNGLSAVQPYGNQITTF